MSFFDINNVIFSISGYDICALELLGFVTGFLAIYLAGQGNVLNFWIGLLNCAIYFAFFFQANLYSMMFLQLIFFAINVFGIIKWAPLQSTTKKIKITKLLPMIFFLGIILTIFVGFLWGYAVEFFAQRFPNFVQKPTYPILDAILLMSNVFGQLLLAMKKIENWIVWIVVDVISIVLWLILDMNLTAVLYLLYLIIAIDALRKWYKQMNLECNNK